MYEACQSIQVFVSAYVRTHRTFIRIFTGPRSKISKKYIRGPFGPVFRPCILFVGAVAIMTPLLVPSRADVAVTPIFSPIPTPCAPLPGPLLSSVRWLQPAGCYPAARQPLRFPGQPPPTPRSTMPTALRSGCPLLFNSITRKLHFIGREMPWAGLARHGTTYAGRGESYFQILFVVSDLPPLS